LSVIYHVMSRKKVFLSIIVLTTLFWGYYFFFVRGKTEQNVTYIPAKVQTGSIKKTIKSTGNISPIQQTTLSFTKQWIVSKIYKKPHEIVKAGDIIAEIDSESADIELKSASINLENAQLSYQKLFSSITEIDIIKAKNTLSESDSAQKLTEAKYADLLISQKNALKQAEENIAVLEAKATIAQNDFSYTEKSIQTDTTTNTLERDMQSTFVTLQDIENSMNDIRKTYYDTLLLADKNNPRYGDLGIKDLGNKTLAESTFWSFSWWVENFQKTMKNLRSQTNMSFDSLLSSAQEASNILTQSSKLSSLILIELDTTTSIYYTSDNIDSLKTAIKTANTSSTSKLSSINNNIATLKNYGNEDLQALSDKNSLESKKQSLLSAQNALIQARRDLEALKKSQETALVSSQDDIIKSKNTVTLNTATYNELKNGPTQEEILQATNSIKSAELSLEKAKLSKKDYELIAPFDGEIEDIPWNIWDTTLSTEWILISNKDTYEIKLALDQIDIVKVSPWMRAEITLDAFPTETFTGTVSSISATPTVTSGVVSYTAIIQVQIHGKDIMTNMSATVTLILAERNNTLLIPTSAINYENGKSFVRVGSWWRNTAEMREITTWLSENGKTEVLSWITLGEKVLVKVATTSWTWSASSQSSTSKSNTRGTFWGWVGWPPGWF